MHTVSELLGLTSHVCPLCREQVDIGQEVLGDTFTEKEYPHILQGYFGIERAQMSLGEQLKHRYSPPLPPSLQLKLRKGSFC